MSYLIPIVLGDALLNSRASRLLEEASTEDHDSVVTMDEDKFHVKLDVNEFMPEEITINIIEENQITVEGRHDEKPDQHGLISRHIVRKYVIPKGYDMERVESQLFSDGILSISVPKVTKEAVPRREIPLLLAGRPYDLKPKQRSVGE